MVFRDNEQMTSNSPIQIALVTDTHAWPGCERSFGHQGEQLQPWFDRIHGAFLDEMRRAGPDMLIHLGDFVCGGGTFQMPDAEFYAALKLLHEDYSAATPHFWGLPGNHDCPAGSNDYAFCEGLLGLDPRLGQTTDVAGVRLVFLHCQGHSDDARQSALPGDPTFGWIADEELARLDQALAEADQRPVILFTHQLLHPWANPNPYLPLYSVANSQAVLDLLAQHGNVRAVFQGHAHLLDVQTATIGQSPVCFVVAPSLIQFPLGWLLLTLTPESLRVQYRPLPLPDLSERSRAAGDGSDWRSGDPAWQDFTVGL